MKKFFKKIAMEILWLFPHQIAHKIYYKITLKKKLDLDNPKDFNEKIQYLMLNKFGDKETQCADKYRVRQYIEEKGYVNILPKLYKTFANVNEISIEELPNKFVLKTNHASGTVIICQDKSRFDLLEAKKRLKKCLKKNFAKNNLEYHYSNIERIIICEEYIEPNGGGLPEDYKIYCFNGKAVCTLVCSERENKLRLDYYDLNWNYLDYALEEYRSNKTIARPENYEEMIKIAEELSKDFPYVRVDLYNVNGRIYFGELTLTPAAGIVSYNTKEALDYFGNLIIIE